MSITLKATVTFPLSMVFSKDLLVQIEEGRKEARKIKAEQPEKFAALSRAERFKIDLFDSDKTVEQIAETLTRAAIREFIRTDFTKDFTGPDETCRTGDVRVVFENRSVLARSCDCNACYECKIARGGSDE